MSNRKFSPCFTPEQVGERLRTIRKRLDLTQKGFAEALMIDIKSYSKYETGVTYPKVETLSRIAEMAGISVDYLIGRTNDSTQLYSQLDMLGLSEKAAEQLKALNASKDTYLTKSLNLILEAENLGYLLGHVAAAIEYLFRDFCSLERELYGAIYIGKDEDHKLRDECIDFLNSDGFAVLPPALAAEFSLELATEAFREILKSSITKPSYEGDFNTAIEPLFKKFSPRWREE